MELETRQLPCQVSKIQLNFNEPDRHSSEDDQFLKYPIMAKGGFYFCDGDEIKVTNARYGTYAQAVEDCGILLVPDICNNHTIHDILSQELFENKG